MAGTSALHAILGDELDRHPRMTPRDVQKLVYQSVFGGDHALVDRDRFAAWVRSEWDALAGFEAASAPLQSIDPDGRVTRIHLGPCAARGVDVDALIEALWSQPRRGGTRSQYDRRWAAVVRLAEEGHVPFDAGELADLSFPDDLPHHSSEYGRASYRIVNDVKHAPTRRRLRELGVLQER